MWSKRSSYKCTKQSSRFERNSFFVIRPCSPSRVRVHNRSSNQLDPLLPDHRFRVRPWRRRLSTKVRKLEPDHSGFVADNSVVMMVQSSCAIVGPYVALLGARPIVFVKDM